MKSILVILPLALFIICEAVYIPIKTGDDRRGVPDARDLKLKISRGSGMGIISFGYILVVLLAFALFVVVMVLIIYYKREETLRNQERTLFLSPY
ncbi:hypothetical protein JTE90_022187 [Oedothorax gibbosus]|uniref:Uncharacterized protein n=1 Tax=Oedothorax gibbosus TaxID=931172 RepID=A0AAV6VRQ5_9ARAC|nr:hypothetical protein JTE90_022187 [Oedothorax gibbosus]